MKALIISTYDYPYHLRVYTWLGDELIEHDNDGLYLQISGFYAGEVWEDIEDMPKTLKLATEYGYDYLILSDDSCIQIKKLNKPQLTDNLIEVVDILKQTTKRLEMMAHE